MTRIKTLLTSIGICLAAVSCNQNDGNTVTPDPDPSTPATCRLTKLTSPDYTFTISYDGDKRVSEHALVNSSTLRYVYSYAGDYHTRAAYDDGKLLVRDTVRLNGAGYVGSITSVRLSGSDSGQVIPLSYEYSSGNKISKLNRIVSPTQSFVAFQYDYDANGNIAKYSTNAGYQSIYEYYTDKPTRTGDAMTNEYLMDWGAGKVLNNVHLLKSKTINGVTTSYVYTFDGDGKITSYTVQRGSATAKTVTVQQVCD